MARSTATGDEQLSQPLSGWPGHAAPFAFTPDDRPAASVLRFTGGTPSVLAVSALDLLRFRPGSADAAIGTPLAPPAPAYRRTAGFQRRT